MRRQRCCHGGRVKLSLLNSADYLSRSEGRGQGLRHKLCFLRVLSSNLDLYYGHKAQEMLLTNVSDTIHADSLALIALNIETTITRLCHRARNVKHFDFGLTCDVTGDPEVIKHLFSLDSFSRVFKCRLNF